MRITHLFPLILIGLDVCAAGVYIMEGDWRHAGYWLSAASISLFAIIM